MGNDPTFVYTNRLVAAGQVVVGVHNLYWIACNPSASDSEWALSDDTTGGTAIVLDHFYSGREGHVFLLSPPMKFGTGIYLKSVNKMTSMTFGYV